jgi:hypothetical protein
VFLGESPDGGDRLVADLPLLGRELGIRNDRLGAEPTEEQVAGEAFLLRTGEEEFFGLADLFFAELGGVEVHLLWLWTRNSEANGQGTLEEAIDPDFDLHIENAAISNLRNLIVDRSLSFYHGWQQVCRVVRRGSVHDGRASIERCSPYLSGSPEMVDHPISPSESLLLGLCIGEYSAKRNAGRSVYFMEVLKNRFAPFFPEFLGTTAQDTISLDEVPEDVVWSDPFEGCRFGFAPSQPGTSFSWSEHDATSDRLRYTHPERRSLFGLLLTAVGPFMALKAWERFELAHQLSLDRAQAFSELWSRIAAGGREWYTAYLGNEYPPTIETTILKCIDANGDRALFDLGTKFGVLLARIDDFTRYVLGIAVEIGTNILPEFDEPGSLDYSVELSDVVDELLGEQTVQRNHYADSALRALRKDSLTYREFRDVSESTIDYWEDHMGQLAQAHDAIGLVWIAVGELLGMLRDADEVVKVQDATALTPRAFAFAISAKDTPDRIREQLVLARRDLSGNPGESGRPESTVHRVYGAIQAIMERLWPEEFESGSEPRLTDVLNERLYHRGAPELERRFASIARPPCNPYRQRRCR